MIALCLGTVALAACTSSRPPTREHVEQGWALVIGNGDTVGCCSGTADDPGGPSRSLRAAYWRDASEDTPGPWYEPGPVPSCLRARESNRLRLRVLDVPEREGRPATSIVTEVECLGYAELVYDQLVQQ